MTRGQSDGPKNFYAISKGRRTGIFKGVAWSEVKPLVDGFSGNAYKGFVTIEEAIEFMKKGGFSDSDIHIYDNVMSNDAVKESTEPASPTTDAANAAPDNGDMFDTSDTEIKFFDAEMLNDIDRVSRNEPNTSTAMSESTENAQCSASSDQRKPYCVRHGPFDIFFGGGGGGGLGLRSGPEIFFRTISEQVYFFRRPFGPDYFFHNRKL